MKLIQFFFKDFRITRSQSFINNFFTSQFLILSELEIEENWPAPFPFVVIEEADLLLQYTIDSGAYSVFSPSNGVSFFKKLAANIPNWVILFKLFSYKKWGSWGIDFVTANNK